MGIEPIFNRDNWAVVPFHFWSAVFFVLGTIVGSFLNVCIHRMPLDESIVSPPSHCPHCRYSIPWFLNIPLVTWLWLRGKCANCGAPISPRYFVVELLTGIMFLGSWLVAGRQSPLLALVYCVFLAGLIVATFIDSEHLIIPDEITFGGMVVGLLASFVLPVLHGQTDIVHGLKDGVVGLAVGGGVVYLILRGGKLAFGRQQHNLSPGSRVVFTETAIIMPDGPIPYEEVFNRQSDTVYLEASRVELCDRCYSAVQISLTPSRLTIGEEEFDPETVPYLEAVTDRVTLPREAMGLGDVKFMAAIGAFLGWSAVLFCLFVSSIVGAVVGLLLIRFRHHSLQSRLPYGPYIALAAVVWIFGGHHLWDTFWAVR